MFKDRIKKYVGISIAFAVAIVIAICVFFVIFRFDKVAQVWDSFMGILMPFIYGAVIAYLLRPVCNLIERNIKKLLDKKTKLKPVYCDKISRWTGIIVSLLSAVLVIYVLIAMIVPQIWDTINGLIDVLPQYFNKSVEFLENFLSKYVRNSEEIEATYEMVYDEAYKWIKGEFVPSVQTAVAGVSTGVVSIFNIVWDIVIGIIVSVYLLYNRRKFLAQMKLILYSIFTERWANKIAAELRLSDKMFGGFINGKLIDSFIIGVLCYIIVKIVGIPYPLLISVIIGITNIVPFFGPIIGAIPCVMLIFILNPIKAFYLAIILLALQFFDGNILGPKILGDATGINSFWVLFSVMFFGGIFGFIGMVIAVPLFAVIYDIIKQLVNYGLKKNRKLDMMENYEKEYGELENKESVNKESDSE